MKGTQAGQHETCQLPKACPAAEMRTLTVLRSLHFVIHIFLCVYPYTNISVCFHFCPSATQHSMQQFSPICQVIHLRIINLIAHCVSHRLSEEKQMSLKDYTPFWGRDWYIFCGMRIDVKWEYDPVVCNERLRVKDLCFRGVLTESELFKFNYVCQHH